MFRFSVNGYGGWEIVRMPYRKKLSSTSMGKDLVVGLLRIVLNHMDVAFGGTLC